VVVVVAVAVEVGEGVAGWEEINKEGWSFTRPPSLTIASAAGGVKPLGASRLAKSEIS